jgi:hypothetical protein
VFGTGSNNICGFKWDYGTVGVSNESWGIWISGPSGVSGITVIGTSIWVSTISVSSISVVGTSIAGTIAVPQTVSSSIKTSSIGKSLSGKVSCFSCLDLWGLGWGNCTVGVGDKLCAGNSDTCEEN